MKIWSDVRKKINSITEEEKLDIKRHASTAYEKILCPDCNKTHESFKVDLITTCSICGQECLLKTAHRYQGKYIGDECCWDERLRSSE